MAGWTTQTTPFDAWAVFWPKRGAYAAGVGVGAGRFVVGGGGGGAGSQGIALSDDGGLTWVECSSPTAGGIAGLEAVDIAWSPGLSLFAAACRAGGIWTSPTGSVWTQRSSLNAVSVEWSSAQSQFVAGLGSGVGSQIATSPTGLVWTTHSSPFDGGEAFDVAYSPSLDLWMAVGFISGVTGAATSPDGAAWTAVTTPFDGGASSPQCVTWAPLAGRFFVAAAAGVGTAIVSTGDGGATWSSHVSAIDGWDASTVLELGDGTLIAAAQQPAVYALSFDGGSSWVPDTPALPGTSSFLAGPGDILLAVNFSYFGFGAPLISRRDEPFVPPEPPEPPVEPGTIGWVSWKDGDDVYQLSTIDLGTGVATLVGETVEFLDAIAWSPPAVVDDDVFGFGGDGGCSTSIPDNPDDFYIARLPFHEAQCKLSAGGHTLQSRRLAHIGWHGSKFDPEYGSFAIVRSGGPFAEMVGKRMWVATRDRRRAVYAFVHTEADIFEDVSLHRRLFEALAPLAAEEVRGFVEESPRPVIRDAAPAAAKVLKADSTLADAWVKYDTGSEQPELWASFGLAIDEATRAAWADQFGGYFAMILDATDGFIDALYWDDDLWVASFGDSSLTPPLVAGEWFDVELHLVEAGGPGGQELYINGELVITADAGFVDIRKLLLGQENGVPVGVVYVREPKLGTLRGASDLFRDDFSSGDLSAWTETEGDVSVVDDPFFTP